MSRSYSYVDWYSTKIQCIADYGIFEGEKQIQEYIKKQLEEDQLADLFRTPLGVLSVLRPYRA